MEEMTGGANNLASFMEQVKKERQKTNEKLYKCMASLEKLQMKVFEEGGSNGKVMSNLVKKCTLLEKTVQDLDHEVKTTHSFKKQQMKVVVDDIDDLIRNKGEFKQKTDYLFEKIQQIQKEVDSKIVNVIEQFESIKSPLVNKVQDIYEASKLYHHEMTRTQNINREMLIDLNRINQEYEAALEKNASIEHNMSQMHDPMAMSIFSNNVGGGMP